MFEFITNSEERGQVGIGTLIVFIAMVLVAAIAAGVLINTAGFLQSQAEATGQESTDLVSERIEVGSSVGIVASGASTLSEIRVSVSGAPGADNIDLTETTVQAVGPAGQENLVFIPASTAADTSFDEGLTGSDIDAQTEVSENADSVEVSIGDGYSITTSGSLTITDPDDNNVGTLSGSEFSGGDVVTVDVNNNEFSSSQTLSVSLNPDGSSPDDSTDSISAVAGFTVDDIGANQFAVQSDGNFQSSAVLDSESQFQIILNPDAGAFKADGTAFGESQEATLDIVSPAGATTQVELRAPDLFDTQGEAVRL
ncbi:archaellin/type IV pilin N-terminal domain-containing protein [Halorubrum ezzemoulense]|uniref:archaellin/type IV pilin N-terminal domain-containing protein n=1 Tax=Halorubrum ezzemoulense TaxID=337243 RepID=UPI002814AE4D|nr:archaellin/type IV pilin N-terminal domain-containing protein [Halorubrum ezzemoulense]